MRLALFAALGTACILAPASAAPPKPKLVTIDLKMNPAGAEAAGYRVPQRLEVSAEKPTSVKKEPAYKGTPSYGTLHLGSAKENAVLVVLDRTEGADPVLYLDANGDGDLTNDPGVKLERREQKAQNPDTGEVKVIRVQHSGEAKVNAHYEGGKAEPVRIAIFHLVDLQRPANDPLKNLVLYDRGYAREGEADLGGKKHKVLLLDEEATGRFDRADHPEGSPPHVSLLVDRNDDGKFDRRYERYDLAKPFNIGGTTYELGKIDPAGARLTLKPSDKQVAEVPIPPSLGVGQPALAFSAKDMSGKSVQFPSVYKGKVVMLDFWATWCPPCREEVPHLVAAYKKHHGEGFEILGVSLDRPDQEETVRKFLDEHEMTWSQVYDPKAAEPVLATKYFIESIPSAFLVDGTTGKILAADEELRGDQLEETLKKALANRRQ